MSVAITKSRAKTFHLLSLQMNDIVIQNIPNKEILFYVVDINSFEKMKTSAYFKNLKSHRDKFIHPDCHKGIYIFSGTNEELMSFLREIFKNKIEIIPKYFFEKSHRTFH